MAIVPATGIASFDLRNAVPIDISEVLHVAIARDDPRFSVIANVRWGENAKDTTHYWIEYKPTSNKAQLNEAVDITAANTDNVFTFTPETVGNLRVGAMLRDITPGKREVVMVLAISGNDVTVKRGYPDEATNLETHAKDSIWQRIGSPKQEGEDASIDPVKDRTKGYNYTQIFERGLKISKTAQMVKKYAVASEFDFQLEQKTWEIKREIADTLLNGIRSADAGSDTTLRTMGGILQFISQPGGNVVTTAEAVSLSVLNNLVGLVWEDAAGSVQDLRFVVSGKQQKKIQAIVPAGWQLTMEQTSQTLGNYIADFQSDIGLRIPFIVDPYMPDDVIALIDFSKVELNNLRPLELVPVPTKADAKEAQIITELTLSVYNALEAHAVHYNLTV